MQLRLPIIALLCLISGKSIASAEVITFDNFVAPPGNDTTFGQMTVDDLVFTSPHAHVVTSPSICEPECADNGTHWIGGDTTSISVAREDGRAFSLTAFDAAEAFTGFAEPGGVVLSGLRRSRPAEILATFAFDGIGDGTGGLVDFQTFLLDPGWTDLRQVTFRSSNGASFFGLDNLVINPDPVPEPGTLLMFGTGLAGAALRAARCRRR